MTLLCLFLAADLAPFSRHSRPRPSPSAALSITRPPVARLAWTRRVVLSVSIRTFCLVSPAHTRTRFSLSPPTPLTPSLTHSTLP
ncbi:hypothetical protein E2C01_102857 [Portunus trituberculatus]|uniref:Secreted protein n=1 Tax=Portunus trituberculatus TaxID=210409 RepID=A0A5B7KJI0_PORTR|nr:hypothetical protein [Portunus trituberculatus]